MVGSEGAAGSAGAGSTQKTTHKDGAVLSVFSGGGGAAQVVVVEAHGLRVGVAARRDSGAFRRATESTPNEEFWFSGTREDTSAFASPEAMRIGRGKDTAWMTFETFHALLVSVLKTARTKAEARTAAGGDAVEPADGAAATRDADAHAHADAHAGSPSVADADADAPCVADLEKIMGYFLSFGLQPAPFFAKPRGPLGPAARAAHAVEGLGKVDAARARRGARRSRAARRA